MKNERNHKHSEETFGLASEKSTRQQALEWWNNLISDGSKAGYAQKHLQVGVRYKSLTGREIEQIWKNELPLEERESYYGIYKPNQI